MKLFIYIITGLLLISCASPSYKGNKKFGDLAYAEAIPNLKKAYEKKQDFETLAALAECYRKINNSQEAEIWFSKVVNSPKAKPEHRLYYANALKNNEKYDLAKIWYAKYLDVFPTDKRVISMLNSCDSLSGFAIEAFLYKIDPLTFDSTYSNFSPIKYKNGIVFCSEKNATKTNQINPWNERPFLDLYFIEVNENGIVGKSKPFGNGINSKFHEGPSTFSKDLETLYFTRSNFNKKKIGKSLSNENNLKIFSVTSKKSMWGDVISLSFNSDEYSCGHPTFSSDGKTLYFISDMPGGIGGTDIYKSTLTNGKFGKPENIGAPINTSGNEMFPFMFVDVDGTETLYFSSDGHDGIGGLDIYESVKTASGWEKPKHLQYPVNGYKDDFGVMINPGKSSGYFSSNRKGDGSVDRIYKFEKTYPTFFVEGIVVKKGTKTPIENASIKIIELKSREKDALITNKKGQFIYPVGYRKNYSFQANRPDYFSNTVLVSTLGKTKSDTIRIIIELDQIVIDKPIVLENIYYDYDKWNIRPDAAIELDKLVKILTENREITIELSSHTDSRGSDKYNQILSQKRAESAVDYIITVGGISSSRITAKGYGEAKLVNNCKNNVYCSEEEHQLNRRTEFKVTKLN